VKGILECSQKGEKWVKRRSGKDKEIREERKLEAYSVSRLKKYLNSYADVWHFKVLIYIGVL